MSRGFLAKLSGIAREPVSLIGGWGVYFRVAEPFRRRFGYDYSMSRDIDLGFHVDPEWSQTELEQSSLLATCRALEAGFFEEQGSRYRLDFDYETGEHLKVAEAKAMLPHQVFCLFVDPIVDNMHAQLSNILGFTPIQDPVVRRIISQGRHDEITEIGAKFHVPHHLELLEMKLGSCVQRGDPSKVAKDVSDMFALLATAPEGPLDLVRRVEDRSRLGPAVACVSGQAPEAWADVVRATNQSLDTLRTVLSVLETESRRR